MEKKIALIGLGVIGAPIAHKLYQWDKSRFVLIADEERKGHLLEHEIKINGELFAPQIISDSKCLDEEIELLIVCVKNCSLERAIGDIRKVITERTIILPLENGIVAYRMLRKEFPNNIILEGYAQGPNTERITEGFSYQNPGAIHMGSSKTELCDAAIQVYLRLKHAGVNVVYEAEIRKMVWKKWMLNAAGNTVTALLEANYADFKKSVDLQNICRKIMLEFTRVAEMEHIHLSDEDIESVIKYYVNYNGQKCTSMLEDVLHKRRTENEYITGEVLRMAEKHRIAVPVNETMYLLIKAKESLYIK